MTQLLVLKEHLIKLYQKYAPVLNPSFRFLIGFITFSSINKIIGYNPSLTRYYVTILLSAFSTIMPGGVLLFAASVYVVAQILYVSDILAVVVAILLIIIYYAYLKFARKQGYIILAFLVAFPLHLAYGIPIYLGLMMTPIAVVPLACGVGFYFLLQTITSVISTSADTNIDLYHVVLQQFMNNKEMWCYFVIFSMIIIVVYILRNCQWNYAFEIAIAAGCVMNILLGLITNFIFEVNEDMLLQFFGALGSTFIVLIVHFMRLTLNYAGVENLQFEDEEYYYYVRAVPKMNVTAPNWHVKHFGSDISEEELEEKEDVEIFEETEINQEESVPHDFNFKVSVNEEDFRKKK